MFPIQGTPTLLDGSSGFRAISPGQNMENKLHQFATSEVFMSESTSASVRRSTQEIPFEQWIPFLAGFTRENRGAHARLEIIGADCDVGFQVETEIDPSTVFRPISKAGNAPCGLPSAQRQRTICRMAYTALSRSGCYL